MIRKSLIVPAMAGMIFLTASVAYAWGVWGHENANRAAVMALPEPMRIFFFNHIDFITHEATVPDLRKYTLRDKAEGPRHFFDMEDYGFISLDSFPKTMRAAQARFDEKTMQSNGILPWYLQEMMEKLTDAFKKKRRNEILFLAGDLGHYLADANMPLHTSSNHDGQLTNQKGIHSFWEAQLPEYFGTSYNLNVKDAVYQQDIAQSCWDILLHSHHLADSLLAIERNVLAAYKGKDIYRRNDKGDIAKNIFEKNIYSDDFSRDYHQALKGMVESQLRHAIQDIANFWYTAWVNAGKPDLSELDDAEVTRSNADKYKAAVKAYQKGRLDAFTPEKEYRGY